MTKENKAGPREILTLALARKIVLMIQNFPDAGIDATWDNVYKPKCALGTNSGGTYCLRRLGMAEN